MDDMFRSSDISSASLYWCRISSTFFVNVEVSYFLYFFHYQGGVLIVHLL